MQKAMNFSLSPFQPSLLKAIFNVDPDEVRSLIFKKEDVNVQVTFSSSLKAHLLPSAENIQI